MMVAMKHRLLTLLVLLSLVLTPVAASARNTEDEDTVKQEARLEGYGQSVRLKEGSTALTWLMIGFLSAVAIAVLFKNPKRSHLD
jgi:hypothetical protein